MMTPGNTTELNDHETAGFPSGDGPAGLVDLTQLLANLGPSVARVLAAPKGLDVSVGDPLIYDPIGDAPLEADAIVLAIGILADSTEARSLIQEAGRVGAAVVVFKMHERDSPWIEEAEAAGVALVSVTDEMSWSHLNALLALTIPSLRQSTSIPGMSSVPLGDLFSLANAVAALVSGAITIEDQRGRVLAYSNLHAQTIDEPRRQSILGRQVPDTPAVRELYKQLWSSEKVIRVDSIDGLDALPRIACPIIVGTQTLGSIWAVEGETRLSQEAEGALREAARVASLHMIHARSSRDIERRTKGDLVRSILEGRGDPSAIANRLGIPRRSPLIVCGFEIIADTPIENLHRERLVDLVATYSEAFRLQAAAVAIGHTVFCLLPVPEQTGGGRTKEIARKIQEHASANVNLPIHAAVSSPVPDVMDVPGATREVERILRILSEGGGEGRIASIGDVRSGVTLLALRELARNHPDLVKGTVEEIAAHDAHKNTTYLETLRAYLAAFGDVPRAAEALNVHPNTFRYRIRRLTELFDVNLNDPDDRLVIELQLRLIGTSERGGG